MWLWTVVYQDGPEYEPETSEGPKHVENRLPPEVLAQIAGGRHGNHCAQWSTSRDERCEPEYFVVWKIFVFPNSGLLTCFSLVALPI